MINIKNTLATKLSMSILMMAIPVFLISMGLVSIQSRKAIHAEAVERANSTLNTTMQRVRNYMTALETATNSNAWYAEKYFEPDSLLALTHRIVRLNSHVNGCSITAEPNMFPKYGYNFSAYTVREGDSILTQREADYDYYSQVWYKAAVESRKALWTDPFDDYMEGTLSNSDVIASYSKPLYKDDKLIGVISTDMSFSRLDKMINSQQPPYPGAYYVLMGGDGTYYIHPDKSTIFKKNIFKDVDPNEHPDVIALGHEMTQGNSGAMHVQVDGKLYHICYCPIKGTDWSLSLVCLDSEILKGYNYLTYLIIALTIIGLLVIFLLCRRGVNEAIRPLNKLLGTLKKMSEDRYDLLIPHTDREDAVGSLQNSFATMNHSINTYISDISKTADKTKQSNVELACAMKLAKEGLRQKDIFIQNVSHQIRTPLNIIHGFAQVLHDNPDLPKNDLKEITTTMKHNALHLNRMVQMLYDSSFIGTTKEMLSHRDDLVSCNQLAGECIRFTIEHFPNAKIQFLTDVDDNFNVKTSHLYLMRTLRELLYNAAKYSDSQNITMRITNTDKVRFIVEDKGQGLPEEAKEMIFKAFTKVDDLSEGLGLGLPLSKQHALSLGGDLTLDTSYKEGCRFILEIPKQ